MSELTPAIQQQTLTQDDTELLAKVLEQFDDCGETDVDNATLMRFVGMGLLRCTRFEATPKAIAVAANTDAPIFQNEGSLLEPQSTEPVSTANGTANWAEYPAQCPITRRDFFMVIEHPDLGMVPTYGGPYDSYTIPEMTGQADQPWHKRELFVRRYDHDIGGWVEDEFIPMRVISEEALFDLEEKAEAAGEAAQPGLVDSAFYANLKRSRDKHPGIKQMFDGLLGEVHELKRAYKGDGNLQAEALDVAVCAYRIAMEGDEGGNLKLDQVPDWMAWNAPVPLPIGLGPATGKHDPLYATAVDLVRKLRIASISAVQRHLRIGYNRAAYMLEAMEGTVVSFPDGAGVRQVLQDSPAPQDAPVGSDSEGRRG